MMDEALSPAEPVVVVVDVETTGLSPFFDRVCEVGILRARGDEILETFDTLVNPGRPISPGASAVNGLRDDDLWEAPRFEEIADEVHARLDGALLVCHNAPFDLGFLDAELSRSGYSFQPGGVIDTLALARRYFHFGSNGLASVAARLGIETPQAHRALGDALTTFRVLRHFSRRLSADAISPGGVAVGGFHSVRTAVDPSSLPPEIQEALRERSALEIRYVDASGNLTQRMVTPLRVEGTQEAIYLVAYCHTRAQERHFRLDRIVFVGRGA